MLYPDFNELVEWAGKRARLDMASSWLTFTAAAGGYASPFRGQGLTFHEVREYRPGDDVRNIDWRVTARVNRPHMKVFTEDRERTVMLCIDANAAMRFGTRGTFKSIQAARAAAMLGWLANGSHDRVGCLLFGDVPGGMRLFKPSRSRRSLWQALKELSLKKTGMHVVAVPVEEALRQLDRVAPSGSLIFVIGDFQPAGEGLEKVLSGLQRRCDIVLLRIDDPADGAIPPIGLASFSNDKGENAMVDTDDGKGREAYAAQWRDSRGRLEDICIRHGIGMLVLHTSGDVRQDLLPGLHRLALGKCR